MANQETQFLDDVIVKSRRKMLSVGLSSLAGVVGGALTGALAPAAQAATFIANTPDFAWKRSTSPTLQITITFLRPCWRRDKLTRLPPSTPSESNSLCSIKAVQVETTLLRTRLRNHLKIACYNWVTWQVGCFI